MTELACFTCRFFDVRADLDATLGEGLCRRNAPTPTVDDVDFRVSWPVVGVNDWCGEHTPRAKE